MTNRDRFIKEYIDTMNSTNHTIACGLVLATFYVVVALVADLAGHQLSEATMDTLGLFIGAMLGVGVGQFFGKRFSDSGYAAAKAGANPQVIIPSTQTNVSPGAAPEPPLVIPNAETK